ncbi:hypothetical protein IAD21_00586 [Abditibacteriota bacterium]|nr:hypothetical protein IAD21_00586 [Abditibacteriota bacterium]
MKITHLDLAMAQHGIVCDGQLSVPTRRQCTNETVNFKRVYKTKSTILALIHFRIDAKRFARELQKTGGEHDLTPSNYSPGLLGT